MFTVLYTPAGVPVPVDDDGSVIPLIHENSAWIRAMLQDDPTLEDRLLDHIKVAVEGITGIDSQLPMGEWWMEWQNLLTILQFTTPLSVIQQARHLNQQMEAQP